MPVYHLDFIYNVKVHRVRTQREAEGEEEGEAEGEVEGEEGPQERGARGRDPQEPGPSAAWGEATIDDLMRWFLFCTHSSRSPACSSARRGGSAAGPSCRRPSW